MRASLERIVALVVVWVMPSVVLAREVIDPPVSRVVLYASGVGYFEHALTVRDDVTLTMHLRTEQINDLLKSLVVMAPGSALGGVSYAANEPLERALRSFGVDLSDQPTLANLLRQLRGSEVRVEHGGSVTVGRVLQVESRNEIGGEPAVHVVVDMLQLVTEQGLVSLPLSSVGRVELTDENLRRELNKALLAMSESRDAERRSISLDLDGRGERSVRVGYLVQTPVWKTSYRLSLDEGGEGKAMLQGWAIVENTSESDWTDVQLGMVSGRPISFIQDLYTPLYLQRPVVEQERAGSLAPQAYEGGISLGKAVAMEARADAAGHPPASAMMRLADMPMPASEAVSLATLSAQASGGSVGELFEYTIDRPVTLPRKQSAMLPILQSPVSVERVSIYNASVQAQHPLHGAWLTNDSALKLLAGPITVFDGGAYAGDARIDHVAENERRLLSYGVDLSVRVDASENTNHRIATARIVKGVLELKYETQVTQVYAVENKAEEARQLIIEHPRVGDRRLTSPEAYEEKTESLYRFRLPVKPLGKAELKVVEAQTSYQSLVLLDYESENLLGYARNGQIPQPVRDALTKAAQLRGELDDLTRQLDQTQRQSQQIKEGQDRLRRNIDTAGRDSALGKRYLAKLNAEEDELEQLAGRIVDLQQRAEAKRQQLATYLQSLEL